MTNYLGFQTIKICDPQGPSDIIVVKIDGKFIVGYSYNLNWIKLQEGPSNFGYGFRAINELSKYMINWNVEDAWNLDNKSIGKLSLCIFSENLSPIITELLDIEDNTTQKKIKIIVPEQVIFIFETEKYSKIENINTIVTMNHDDNEFIFEPELIFTNVTMENKNVGNFFEDLNKKSDDYVSFNEIIHTDLFGDVSFTILNNKMFTRFKDNNRDIFVELDNSTGNINADNTNHLKIIMESYNIIKDISEEYIINNFSIDYKVQDFFMELFLNKKNYINNENNDLDKYNELNIIEKINFISFSKLVINYSTEEQYNIKLGLYSGTGNSNSSLWFQYNNDFSINEFIMKEK